MLNSIGFSKIRGFGMAMKFVYYLPYTKNFDVLAINETTVNRNRMVWIVGGAT